jgi:ribosomal protein L29
VHVHHILLIYLVNSCFSQAKPSCDEHVLVETYDNLIASKNDELKRENEVLKMELSRLRGKGHVQPSQDNRDHMVRNLRRDQSSHVPICLNST